MSASLRAFVCKAPERNRISFGDLRRLQRTVLPHGLVTREQAEVLIALDQTITRTDRAWAGYLVAAVTDFVVWRSSSPSRVEPETAAWLVASLSCGRPTRTTGMIARAIVREAQHCEGTCHVRRPCCVHLGVVAGPHASAFVLWLPLPARHHSACR